MSPTLSPLSSQSRTWIFQADRIMTPTETGYIHQMMSSFIPQWASHGNDLYGGYTVEENLFLVVGVDEAKSPASGCSIDALTRTVKEIGSQLNVDFFNRLAIAYQNKAGNIEIVSMAEFKNRILQEQITMETIVFNNLVNTKKDFEQNWRTPVKNSWHTNLFEVV